MLSRLSSGSGPLWLLQHSISPSATFCPLLLLPGDGGEAVEVEAPLLLACSPLLRRTLASTCCGSCFSWPATVILPSTTSAALHQLAQVLGQGSVTIAADDLDELSGLFALLEFDFGRAAGAKRKTARSDLETPPTVLKNSASEGMDLYCSAPTASSPTTSTFRTSCDPTASKLVAFKSSRPPPSLVDSIPLSNATGDPALKVKSPAEKLPKSSIACFFCDLIMPSGTDQNFYLQHLETCNARQVLEADHLRKTLKTEEEVVELVEPYQGGSSTAEGAIRNQNTKLNRYPCKEPGCGKRYVDSRELANHNRRAHEAPTLKCLDQSCNAEFVAEQNLNPHMWAKHGFGKGPKCDVCGKRLAREVDLRDHMRSSHGAPKLKCDMLGCCATFSFENGLRTHMKKHT